MAGVEVVVGNWFNVTKAEALANGMSMATETATGTSAGGLVVATTSGAGAVRLGCGGGGCWGSVLACYCDIVVNQVGE